MRRASYYESRAMYLSDQPDFLNTVVEGFTRLSPLRLLRYIQSVELLLGRRRSIRYGPRSVDIDILLYDNLRVESAVLSIPHPLMHERPFVLFPLRDLAPELRDPRSGRHFRSMLEALPQRSVGIRAY